jgi:integrase
VEFRPGSSERRENRRICPSCRSLCGAQTHCPKCGKATEARIQITWFVLGARNRRLTATWTERDAAEVLRREEADYWRRQQGGVARAAGGTLQAAVEAYQAAKAGYSANYRKQIRTTLQALMEGLGREKQVTTIQTEDVLQFRDDGLEALAVSSVRTYMLVLRNFFQFLAGEGWIRTDPSSGVKLPGAKAKKDFLRPEEIPPVLQAFWRLSADVAPIATALIFGGWRKGEIVNLRRPDVDLTARWAYVLDFEGDDLAEDWDVKTESSRRAVPLHAAVVEALQRVPPIVCHDGRTSPWMFPVLDRRKHTRFVDVHGRQQPAYGDRRSPATTFFGAKLKEVLAAAGVARNVTVHGLRRTFSVLLQEAGAPDSIIRQALGHRERGVTEFNYLPRRDEVLQRWVDKITV